MPAIKQQTTSKRKRGSGGSVQGIDSDGGLDNNNKKGKVTTSSSEEKKNYEDSNNKGLQTMEVDNEEKESTKVQCMILEFQRLLNTLEGSSNGGAPFDLQDVSLRVELAQSMCQEIVHQLDPSNELESIQASELERQLLVATQRVRNQANGNLQNSGSNINGTITTNPSNSMPVVVADNNVNEIRSGSEREEIPNDNNNKKLTRPKQPPNTPVDNKNNSSSKTNNGEIEEAVAEMVSQMKMAKTAIAQQQQSSSRHDVINEENAATALEDQQAQEPVHKSSKWTIGVWVIIVAFVGMLAFGYRTYTAPQQLGTCLFFCPISSNAIDSNIDQPKDVNEPPLQQSVDYEKVSTSDEHGDPEQFNSNKDEQQETEQPNEAKQEVEQTEPIMEDYPYDGVAPEEEKPFEKEDFWNYNEEEDNDDGELPDPGTFQPVDVSIAAASGRIKLLKAYLLRKPAWANVVDKNGWAPIHEASAAGKAKAVSVLIQEGCILRMVTNKGKTALDIALDRWPLDHQVVKVLSEAMDMDETKLQQYYFHTFLPRKNEEQGKLYTQQQEEEVPPQTYTKIAIPNRHDALAEALREFEETKVGEKLTKSFGRKIDDDDTKESPPENTPMYNGRPFTAQELRQAAVLNDGYDLLQGYLAAVQESRADSLLNGPDDQGWTALHLAVDAGNYESVYSLLKAGADISLETRHTHNTALDIAYHKFGGKHRITRILEEYEEKAEYNA